MIGDAFFNAGTHALILKMVSVSCEGLLGRSGGVLTNVCVFATASQAVDRLISVCLVEDACAAFSFDWHKTLGSAIAGS
jgi:isochorismate hydrolase